MPAWRYDCAAYRALRRRVGIEAELANRTDENIPNRRGRSVAQPQQIYLAALGNHVEPHPSEAVAVSAWQRDLGVRIAVLGAALCRVDTAVNSRRLDRQP